MRWLRAASILMAVALAPGCAHRVAIVSEPLGAQVRRDGELVGSTPSELVVWSMPFTRPTAKLTMPGYRPMEVALHKDRKPMRRFWEFLTLRWRKAFALSPTGLHEVLMVERHGPAGTWTPEDVPD